MADTARSDLALLPSVFHDLATRLADIGIVGDWITTPPDTLPLGSQRGAYLLAIQLSTPIPEMKVGRRVGDLCAGLYIYAGNAYGPGGLGARLRRHLRANKTPHWHIDRLTTQARSSAAIAIAGEDECRLVARLLQKTRASVPLPGFGSSDCRQCPSHLLAIS